MYSNDIQPEKLSIDRNSLVCERCRLRDREVCSRDTPCLHCVRDNILCTRRQQGRPGSWTKASEESIEFYEYQLHHLSNAILRLYTLLRQHKENATQAPVTGWPEAPEVHKIVVGLGVLDDEMDFEPHIEDKNHSSRDQTGQQSHQIRSAPPELPPTRGMELDQYNYIARSMGSWDTRDQESMANKELIETMQDALLKQTHVPFQTHIPSETLDFEDDDFPQDPNLAQGTWSPPARSSHDNIAGWRMIS